MVSQSTPPKAPTDIGFHDREEVNGRHFFTYMVMRRSLLDGSDYATQNGDTDKATSYKSTVANIETRINSFWKSDHITVTIDQAGGVSKSSGLDASVLIAANVGSRKDGFYTPGSEKVSESIGWN